MPAGIDSSIVVSVSNDSGVSAIGVAVELGMSFFGIGRRRVPVASHLLSVPANQTVSLAFPVPANFSNRQWAGGDVDLSYVYDANTANNHAVSMWQGLPINAGLGPNQLLTFPVFNEFSSQTEQISFVLIPAPGVVLTNPPAPMLVAPGQQQIAQFNATLSPSMDGGTFLATVVSVVGSDANGNFLGALTLVAGVDD